MKAKAEYILLLLVIAGLVVYLAIRSTDQTHFEMPEPASLKSSEIDRIVVSKLDRTVELSRRDDDWFIEPQGYPADGIKVKNMVNAAANLRITALVSESENYTRYDLGKDKGINVKVLADGKEKRQFIIGRAAPTYQHTFVRIANDPNVYHARGSLQHTFDQSIENLRDKTVLRFDKSAISSVSIRRGEHAVTITRGKPPETTDEKTSAQVQWKTTDGRTVDAAAVERLLSTMYEFKCDGFLDAAVNKQDQKPSLGLTFKDEQTSHGLSLFPKADENADRVPASASDSAYDFELLESRVQTIEKQVEKLMD